MKALRTSTLLSMLALCLALAALATSPHYVHAQEGEGEEQAQEGGNEGEDGEDEEHPRMGTFIPEEQVFDPEFHPNYKLTFTRDQDVSSWNHGFDVDYSFTPKVSFNARSNIVLRENEALNRLNRQETWNAGLSLALSNAISTGLRFTRNDQEDIRNPGKSNETRTFRERESFNLTTDYRKVFMSNVGVNLGVSGGFEKNEYSNVLSTGSSQGVSAGLNYEAPLGISTRFQYSGSHSLLDSQQGDVESIDESFDHNLSGHVEYDWMSNGFVVDVRRGVSSKEYPKQQQTENRRSDTESVDFAADVALIENLSTSLSLGYSRSKSEYKIEQSKDSDLKTRSVRASLAYEYESTRFTAEMSSERKRSEYYDIQTGDQYSNAFGASVTQDFSEELRAVVRARTSLLSHHYDDTESNDQDRDLFDQEATLQVDYEPRDDIRTSLSVKIREDNLIYIRSTRTGDNKTSQTYSVQPSITKKFGSNVSVTQKYGLSADYTFYSYDPDSNFLIRNFNIGTSIDWRPFGTLRLSFSHKYRSQDEGAYIEDEDGIERYGKNSERDDNSLELGVGYKLFGFVNINVKQNLSIQRRWDVEDGERELSWEKFDTTLSGRASADYELSSGTKLEFSLGRIYRDATNITDRQREVWDISLNINKTF